MSKSEEARAYCNGISSTAKGHCIPMADFITENPDLDLEDLARLYGGETLASARSLTNRLIACGWIRVTLQGRFKAINPRPDTMPEYGCHRYPRMGYTVCNNHGGLFPSVIKSAESNLLHLVEPAVERIGDTIKYSGHTPSALKASEGLLDRVGVKKIEEIKVTHGIDNKMLSNLDDEELRTLLSLHQKLKPREDATAEVGEKLGIDIPKDF